LVTVLIFTLEGLTLIDSIVTSAYRDGHVSYNFKMNMFLIVPVAMSKRIRFAIREGGKMENTVQVKKIVDQRCYMSSAMKKR
jgi:translation elongation factor EF-Tu-like GTPase